MVIRKHFRAFKYNRLLPVVLCHHPAGPFEIKLDLAERLFIVDKLGAQMLCNGLFCLISAFISFVPSC
ncbi:Uncharacterised protein [Mycobacteroides abscessus subsp. abscessus]|nr:Uncharacterised protein [Mycobacteroides abscessus subsp. abscessus]